ncbi:serine/threonine-protein kinase [Microtetraspora malaysiensis]|uniref:serine/threonine-protein kinase n=1 Tax=Microtetraspora malaysiensis TaxID=161358 RepID=UPI003D8ED2BE
MTTGGSEASLGSQYVLLNEIGGGGMGTVWRARHRDSGEIVAVKLLRDGLAGDENLVLRFVQERNVMRTLRHPNIVTVRDFVIEGERLALVMDLVQGGDLRALLRERGTLPPADAARLVAEVADALAAAHAQGVVHRDIKPGNVLIDAATGQSRLTDFGVARIVHGPGLTQTTSVIGTPAYLAPEVADGSAPTPAVDVYAIGLILYELLAGRSPFVGDHPMALLRQHATAMPRRLAGMPDPLWPIIIACAAKEPSQRPGAGDVATALRRAAPSLVGLPALPPVPREEAPSATSEPIPLQASPSAGTGGTGDAAVPGPVAPVAAGPAAPGEETALAAPRGRSSKRLVAAVAAGAALALSTAAVAVVAPWRASDTGVEKTQALADASTGGLQKDVRATAADSPTPRHRTRPTRSPSPDPVVSPPPEPPKPSPTKSVPRKTRTPAPEKSTMVAAEPDPDGKTTADAGGPAPEPRWMCRAWLSTGTGTGTEMSPCMAVVDGVFHLLGRVRGSSAVRSDIHVQLYNTDAEVNLSQPFICSGVSPSQDGAIVTCGPFTATTPRIGATTDVRQRWRKTGAPAFGGGAESPWHYW